MNRTTAADHNSFFPWADDATWNQKFRRSVLAWYRRHARNLPWRADRDPYRVWLSEVMLQQTQVGAVGGYFERFVRDLPDVYSLAAANEAQVMRLWEGLGYYRRARQLHHAARIIVSDHSGEFPRDAATLQSLPGIGRYTAGAIASIAFDRREPILEANTKRLLSRLLAYQGDPESTAGQRLLWRAAEEVLPSKSIGAFNQALMELGSEVCVSGKPRCENCPISRLCAARAQGLSESIPTAKKKKAFEEIHEATVAIERRRKFLLVQYVGKERWSGLWDFPRFRIEAPSSIDVESDSVLDSELQETLTAEVARHSGVEVKAESHLARLRHGVTKYKITLDCFRARYIGESGGVDRPVVWVGPEQWDAYPCHSTGRKLRQRLLQDGQPKSAPP